MKLLFISLFVLSACQSFTPSDTVQDVDKLPVETAILTEAPNVPPAIERDYPAKVVVNMETTEGKDELAPGVEYVFWRFGDKVPGPMIRVREGDTVELNFSNHPSSKLPHNIDLHSVTGQGGGAEATYTLPGKTSVMRFRTLKPGLYVYHCATSPVGMHIANGMYGLILVEPKEGLPEVDKEFYVMQSEFYTSGEHGEKGVQQFSLDKAVKEEPDYVVFNGSVGSMTGENALKAKVGESIRMYVGVGGPNLSSSFHIIGEIFDRVYLDAGTSVYQENVQTTLIPSGGATVLEFQVDVPASYVLVDHAIFRAFNKGAIGILKVEGDHDESIITEKLETRDYNPESNEKEEVKKEDKKTSVQAEVIEKPLAKQIKRGQEVYEMNCVACHGVEGKGIKNVFPPLAESDFLNKDKDRSIDVVMHGLTGEITVNSESYDGEMPNLELSDEDIADVLTYIYNNFGNNRERVLIEDVQKRREN